VGKAENSSWVPLDNTANFSYARGVYDDIMLFILFILGDVIGEESCPELNFYRNSNVSIMGPGPALWNQDDLIEERDNMALTMFVRGCPVGHKFAVVMSWKSMIQQDWTANMFRR
jgi:hypothetical protein